MRTIICNFVMAFVLAGIGEFAKAHPSRSDWGELPTSLSDDYTVREDARVLLEIPYDTIIQGEPLRVFFVGIQNFSGSPIKILQSTGALELYQVHHQARAEPNSDNLTRPESIPFWEKLEFEMRGVVYKSLQDGDFQIIDRMTLSIPGGSREMRVGFLVGPNEWIFSEWVPVHRVNEQSLQDGEIIASVEYPGIPDPLPVRIIAINGDKYLFFSDVRFARVPDGASPRIDWDSRSRQLVVHFDGIGIPPLITYMPQRQTIEWTPETAPHMVVRERMKAELERARDAGAPTPEPDPVAAPPADEVPPEPEAIEHTVSPASPPNATQDTAPEPATDPTPART